MPRSSRPNRPPSPFPFKGSCSEACQQRAGNINSVKGILIPTTPETNAGNLKNIAQIPPSVRGESSLKQIDNATGQGSPMQKHVSWAGGHQTNKKGGSEPARLKQDANIPDTKVCRPQYHLPKIKLTQVEKSTQKFSTIRNGRLSKWNVFHLESQSYRSTGIGRYLLQTLHDCLMAQNTRRSLHVAYFSIESRILTPKINLREGKTRKSFSLSQFAPCFRAIQC